MTSPDVDQAFFDQMKALFTERNWHIKPTADIDRDLAVVISAGAAVMYNRPRPPQPLSCAVAKALVAVSCVHQE